MSQVYRPNSCTIAFSHTPSTPICQQPWHGSTKESTRTMAVLIEATGKRWHERPIWGWDALRKSRCPASAVATWCGSHGIPKPRGCHSVVFPNPFLAHLWIFLHLSPLPCFAASCIRMEDIKDIALVMLLKMRIECIQDYTGTSHQNLLDVPWQSLSCSAKLAPWMQDGALENAANYHHFVRREAKMKYTYIISTKNYHITAINWGVPHRRWHDLGRCFTMHFVGCSSHWNRPLLCSSLPRIQPELTSLVFVQTSQQLDTAC